MNGAIATNMADVLAWYKGPKSLARKGMYSDRKGSVSRKIRQTKKMLMILHRAWVASLLPKIVSG